MLPVLTLRARQHGSVVLVEARLSRPAALTLVSIRELSSGVAWDTDPTSAMACVGVYTDLLDTRLNEEDGSVRWTADLFYFTLLNAEAPPHANLQVGLTLQEGRLPDGFVPIISCPD